MSFRSRAVIAVFGGVSLLAGGCADQAPELSVIDTTTPSPTVVGADSSAGAAAPAPTPEAPNPAASTPAAASTAHTNTPEAVAARVVARNQAMLYATSDEIQTLIALDTTSNGRDVLNDLVAERLAPLRASLAQAPAATTWYVVRPLTVHVTDQTSTTATVTVWSTAIFSREGLVDPESWFWLTDMDLVSDDGVWLVDSYDQRPGPAAAPGTDHWPTTATDFDVQLDGHRLLDPDAGMSQ